MELKNIFFFLEEVNLNLNLDNAFKRTASSRNNLCSKI